MSHAAAMPPDEATRMDVVRGCALLDTPQDSVFDEITEFAVRLFGVPIALVTVVDSTRQWFKSSYGLGVRQTPREFSFCAHAILSPAEVFEIADATADDRFADNPLVTGDPFIRFYAGAPLTAGGGFPVGTLAIIDRVPRRLDSSQRQLLRLLARQVSAQVELRWLATRLQNQQAQAESANRAKSEFVTRLSHEMRTPLNAVMGFAELMRQELERPGDSRLMQMAGHIHSAGRHLLTLVQESMDLALIEADAIAVSLAPVELRDALERLMPMFLQQSEAAGITLEANMSAAIPPVLGDRMRLDQVLINLVTNAIKYNRPGGSVRVNAGVDESGRVRVDVIDTGRGLTPDQVAALFEPFNRLGAENGPVEGTGLGLALAQRLVHLMRGELAVHSEPGVGSTFTLRLAIA